MKLKGAAVRYGFGALALILALPTGAAAADMPVLRGSFLGDGGPAYMRWDGLQVSAMFGWSNMTTDFGNSTSPMVAYILRDTTIENEFAPSNWTTLPKDVSNSYSWSILLGYNVQWDQLVLGVDLGYTHMGSMQTAAADTESRQFTTSDNFDNFVSVSGQSSVKLVDYATLRGRAGYAMGRFLPYGTLGVAVGRFDYSVTSEVYGYGVPNASGTGVSFCIAGSYPNCTTASQTDERSNVFVAGLDVGLGLDMAVTSNVFLRGEWEYIAFLNFHGIHNAMNTARVGLGVRF